MHLVVLNSADTNEDVHVNPLAVAYLTDKWEGPEYSTMIVFSGGATLRVRGDVSAVTKKFRQ